VSAFPAQSTNTFLQHIQLIYSNEARKLKKLFKKRFTCLYRNFSKAKGKDKHRITSLEKNVSEMDRYT